MPGLRYRSSMRDFHTPSPGRPSTGGYNRPRKSSIAVAASTGQDVDHVSQNFSLAGPQIADAMAANQSYVDPGYTQLNPAYEQSSNTRPVWGLAKPLPRVLRPGMVPTTSELHTELLHQKQKQQEDLEQQDTGPEQDRVEATLRYDKIVPQLENVREEREIQLCETFGKASPFQSPSIRGGPSTNTGFFSPRHEYAIPEETEELLGEQLHQLSDAISDVRESKLDELPYEDAIPLQAYEADEAEVHNLHTYWSVIRLRFREPLAELLAVCVKVFMSLITLTLGQITVQLTLGFSANLAITVSGGRAGVGDTSDWAWGLATMVAIYIAGGISGAHLNPAMSIMLWIYRGFPFEKVPIYITAQMIGAFLAAFVSFGIYQPGILALGEPNLARSGTAGNFITFPKDIWVSGRVAFFTELTGTTILAITVLALGDDANAPPGAGMNAFIIGLVIVILSMSFGWNTGLAMNPARDFGPRVALHVLGYGNDGNSLFNDGYWFYVAWLGPITGALLGGLLYDAAIFTGGESPVNYPTKRMKRATRKWKKRWQARFRRTKKNFKEVR
jgi:aquaglyceroporin related protein